MAAAAPPPLVRCGGGFETTGGRLGEGQFGSVYACARPHEGGVQLGAAKFERVGAKKPRLEGEGRVYDALEEQRRGARDGAASASCGAAGLPRCLWHGRAGDYYVLVLERLGRPLESIPLSSRGAAHVSHVGSQLLSQYEALHEAGYVHRDAKLDNVLLSLDAAPPSAAVTVHLIDFGLAARYLVGGRHVGLGGGQGLTCAARYSSLNAHKGLVQSRRDDIESLLYMLIHYAKGSLPWDTPALRALPKAERQRGIGDAMKKTSIVDLCSGLPAVFVGMVEYARGIGFEERPNYERLRADLRRAASGDGDGAAASMAAAAAGGAAAAPVGTESGGLAVTERREPEERAGKRQRLAFRDVDVDVVHTAS